MADLFPIAEARGPKTASVIFFHGLGGDAHDTWSADPKDKASFWPAWLAQDIEGLAVYSVGYEASVSGWNGSAMELTDRAANVLNLLLVNPDLGTGELILAGHSLGGLVIKQVLRKAADEATDRAEASSFIERVRKVAFLATPHAGSDLAGWGDRLRVLVQPSAATRSLLRNDQHLRDLNLWYRRWARQRGIDHLILTETKTTSLFGMIVKPDSSDPGLSSDPIPIDTDHIDIAKPVNRKSEVYQLVLNFIKRHTERPVSHEEGPLEKPIDWLFGWKASFERVRQRFGLPVAILLALSVASGIALWNWDHIAKIPFVSESVTFLREHLVPLPHAKAGRVTIAVTHLAGDNEKKDNENFLRRELQGFDGVDLERPVNRTIDAAQGTKEGAEEEARRILKTTRADVLIWGSVERPDGGTSFMRLNWTPSRDVSGAKSTGKYQPTIALPELFWSDLKQILGLLTQSRLAELTDQPGQFVADKLAPLIEQVSKVVESKQGDWDPETLAGVQFSLANALQLVGDQSGTNEPIAESIDLYNQVLREWTREQFPPQWAMTRVALGNSFWSLGSREIGTKRLEDALAAFQDALQVFTRAQAPPQWAGTQINIGNALCGLGERESGTKRLEDALAAYQDASQVYTRAQAPLAWAMIQLSLGVTLAWLGDRENGTERLVAAVAAYRNALQVFTRASVPVTWALTQNDLGGALWRLGERESGTKSFEDARAAFRKALTVNTLAHMPIEWARSYGNQGITLFLLAERRGDAAMAKLAAQQIEEAFTTMRDGGNAYKAAYFEPWLPKARALAEKLAQR
jgi:tetratricopeptide (TPR) repeat protein/pimeloyl-ACP methyl ester carboxylesterase